MVLSLSNKEWVILSPVGNGIDCTGAAQVESATCHLKLSYCTDANVSRYGQCHSGTVSSPTVDSKSMKVPEVKGTNMRTFR